MLSKKASRKKDRGVIRERRLFFIYISPWIAGVTLFVLIPMGTSLYFSFHSATMASMSIVKPRFVLFDNFLNSFKDIYFTQSIKTTFVYSFLKIAVLTVVTTLLALLLNSRIFLKRFSRVLIYIPSVIPVVGSALLWQQMFSSDFSIINFFLSFIGIPNIDWFAPKMQLITVILMSVVCSVGPTMILLIAALQNIPQDVLEASEIDGAGNIRKFFNISLPFLSSTYLYVIITGLIGGLQAYAEFQLLLGQGTATVTMAMNVVNNAFSSRGIGYASSQAWILFVITLLFTGLFFKFSGKIVYYEEGGN